MGYLHEALRVVQCRHTLQDTLLLQVSLCCQPVWEAANIKMRLLYLPSLFGVRQNRELYTSNMFCTMLRNKIISARAGAEKMQCNAVQLERTLTFSSLA